MSGIEFKLSNKIANINFNNISTKNSLDANNLKKISEFLKKIININLNCLIITSSGDTFSSGMNLKEFSIGNLCKNPISEVCDLIESLPFISMCLINGPVYGGSVELVISTDFRIGSKNCKIQIPASKFGIHYGYKGIKRCVDFFGLQNSKKLLLLGEKFTFENLKAIKFLDYYDDDKEITKKILKEKIKNLSTLSLDSIRDMKASINDYKNNNINLENERSRFISGFESEFTINRIRNFNEND